MRVDRRILISETSLVRETWVPPQASTSHFGISTTRSSPPGTEPPWFRRKPNFFSATSRAKVLARDVAEKKFGFRLYQGGSVPGGELRVVEIPEWDVEACGGTHVSRTSDVSLIKILRSTRIQDGVVRLEYAAGKGALEAIRKQTEDLRRVGEILAAPADQIVPTAERIMGEWKELRKVAQKATDERAAAKTKQEIETAKGTWPIVKDEVAQGVGVMMSMSKAT